MTPALSCPSPETLRTYAQGRGPAESLDAFVRHLEQCPRCAEMIDRLLQGDTLSDALRAETVVGERPDPAAIERLVHGLQGAVSAALASTCARGETLAVPPTSPETQELCEFLAPPQAPGELGRLGPYRVLRVLGAGGMGVVFLAEDPQLKRQVALKAMKPSLGANPSARQRFLREAQAAAAVEHDHIVPIYQVGEDRGVPYLVMPLLAGRSLDGLLQATGKLEPAQVVRLGLQIVEGLRAAHEPGALAGPVAERRRLNPARPAGV